MKKYKKSTPRLSVKYIDSSNDNVLFEINDRNWSDVGELLTDFYVDQVVKTELERLKIKLPQNIMVLVVGEYELL
jgi:cytochrome b involved in lipid metabolism